MAGIRYKGQIFSGAAAFGTADHVAYDNTESGLSADNVQDDFSVIGSEFVNFISTVITCRLIKKAREVGLLNEMSYGDLMNDLPHGGKSTHLTICLRPETNIGFIR